MMTKIKICGITNLEDALLAIDAGADFLGFVNARKSPRYLSPEKINHIVSSLPSKAPTVMVTHSQSLDEILDAFQKSETDMVQVHAPLEIGDYKKIKEIAKTIANISIPFTIASPTDELIGRVEELSKICDFILFDTKLGGQIGGTGETFHWNVARELKDYSEKPVFLAGGLTPSNISLAIREVDPYAVDVSSGVELSPGKKDPARVKDFVAATKG